MNYKQLTEVERYQIYVLNKAGHLQKDIARFIKRSESTISRELKRNKGARGYSPKQANRMAEERRTIATKSVKLTAEVKGWIQQLLKQDFSPEQMMSNVENYLDDEAIEIFVDHIEDFYGVEDDEELGMLAQLMVTGFIAAKNVHKQ